MSSNAARASATHSWLRRSTTFSARLHWPRAKTDHLSNLEAIFNPCHAVRAVIEKGKALRVRKMRTPESSHYRVLTARYTSYSLTVISRSSSFSSV